MPKGTHGRLAGKVAFITGAARGQGRSHAVRMAEEGADIIAVDICGPISSVRYEMPDLEDLKTTARLVEDLDRRIVYRTADVRSQAELTDAVAAGVAELGRLDIVIANAGIVTTGSAAELTEHVWDEMIDITLSGVWRTAKAAIPAMIDAQNGGSIGITGSLAGLKGFPDMAHYVSAKHALVGLSRTLAMELAPYRIRVNSVHPTNVDTPMIQYQEFYDWVVGGDDPATMDQFREIFGSMQLLPDLPWVDPVDISNAFVWLASDEARYVTGIALPIDGGAATK